MDRLPVYFLTFFCNLKKIKKNYKSWILFQFIRAYDAQLREEKVARSLIDSPKNMIWKEILRFLKLSYQLETRVKNAFLTSIFFVDVLDWGVLYLKEYFRPKWSESVETREVTLYRPKLNLVTFFYVLFAFSLLFKTTFVQIETYSIQLFQAGKQMCIKLPKAAKRLK